MKTESVQESKLALTVLGIVLMAALPVRAATPCVNPGGTGGCSSSISAAVAAAAAGSAIQVAQGTYKESVVITKTLMLLGDGAVIDATGKSTGFFIDGTASAPNPSVSGVVISGFTVQNANFEGILVANATGVTISGNTVIGNNQGLVVNDTTSCPGLPAFETNEGDDCGEGIHLVGVDHSIVSGNRVENNAGGILISDETGPSHDNLIAGNAVVDNAFDCGITLASHGAAPNLPQGINFGLSHNTVSGNLVSHNGYAGQGAGVGIYAAGPGATDTGNVIIGNVLTDNGLGGVTMHNHAAPGVDGVPPQAPPVNLNDNVIVGNRISGNAADFDDPSSPGPTGISIVSLAPMTGTVISQNDFNFEVADIVFSAPSGTLEAHLNNFNDTQTGVANEAGGAVDATQNWWSCAGGPGAPGCAISTGKNVTAPSWLPLPFAALRPGRL